MFQVSQTAVTEEQLQKYRTENHLSPGTDDVDRSP